MGATDTSKTIADRIRESRRRAGLSQEELAHKLQRRQATMSGWESGRRMPSLEDLYDLAFVLDLDIHSLLPARRLEPPPRGLLRAFAEFLPEGLSLREPLERFVSAARALPPPDRELTIEAQDPEDASEKLLVAGGITEPPVPVKDLARRCGLRVARWDQMDEAVSGMLIALDDAPLIIYNGHHPHGRRRFTIAHELGHLLLRHLETFHVDLASPVEGEVPGYDREQEKAANAFAATLLMPAEWVRRLVESSERLSEVAENVFEVSEVALGFRLLNLGLARSTPPDSEPASQLNV